MDSGYSACRLSCVLWELGGFIQSRGIAAATENHCQRSGPEPQRQTSECNCSNATTRRVTVTPDGAEFYERCVRILADLEHAEASVEAHTRCALRATAR